MKSEAKRMMVMAGGAAASVAATAQGAIVHFNPGNVLLTEGGQQQVFLDLNGGTLSASAVAGTDLLLEVGEGGSFKPYAVAKTLGSTEFSGTTGGMAANYGGGATVDAGSTWGTTTIYLGNETNSVQEGDRYYGFSLTDGGVTNYGWILLDFNQSGFSDFDTATIELNEWAYETTPGTGIVTGAVPEASTSAMMAVLAGSAAFYRRRQRAVAGAV